MTNPPDAGRNLIFLISQPRAGSTMMQRMLGAHPDIYTMSEPWLMLHPLYGLRSEGISTVYDVAQSSIAIRSFLSAIPGGEDDYFRAISGCFGCLYDQALQGTGKSYFLDKTPRYYFIIPELLRTFPGARFIVLKRNPLAVLTSILETWVNGNWNLLRTYSHDLIDAPRLLIDGARALGERATVVDYESLTSQPEREMRRVCSEIGLEFAPSMVEYGDSEQPRWELGDSKSVYEKRRPDSSLSQRWVQLLSDPQYWRLASDYLKALGPTTIRDLGYSFDDLNRFVECQRPNALRSRVTIPLSLLLANDEQPRTSLREEWVQIVTSIQKDGIGPTAKSGGRRFVRALARTK